MRFPRPGSALPRVLLSLTPFLLVAPVCAGVDNPTPANFLRRPYANAVVLGDYVYIDGGEMSQLEDGEYDGNHPSYVVNSTLSLPLNEAWTNSSVTLRSIKKSAPLQDQQVLWSDSSTSSFYTWGGMTAWNGAAVENEIWKFTADGSGGGEWSQVSVSNTVAFTSSIRTLGSAFTSVNGVGYSVGGTSGSTIDTSITGSSIAIQGMITFDTVSREWNNASTAELNVNGTSMNARLEYAPFGTSGFLVMLGGAVLPVGVIDEYEQLEWNNLWVMDLEANKWYSQPVTGSKPTKRERHCSVGVQGPNGTYEIFIYGGASDQTLSTSSDVYVLSLPGFVMFKSPNPGTPRQDFSCLSVGGNSSSASNRQMLVVGGTNGWLGFPTSLTDPDPWQQGLGIFDMTEMTWSSSYDPDAAEYDSPDVVKTWYSQGGLDSVSWSSDELKALFVGGTNSSSTNGNGTSSSGDSSGSGSSGSNSSDSSSKSGSSNTGAIVGGVVGGVGALAIIALVAWLIARRRKTKYTAAAQNPQELANSQAQYYPQEYYQSGGENKAGAWYQPTEMSADQAPVELGGQHGLHDVRYELPEQHAYSPGQTYVGGTTVEVSPDHTGNSGVGQYQDLAPQNHGYHEVSGSQNHGSSNVYEYSQGYTR
ncbi:putative Kelch repeat-containing protein [Seiridium unicorne]|uniref:Kelch repeat-containing protein n=1 Tax=Seiridium unicorne TaxID=138068 RepID=A0ABR2UIU5_9PEZI